jgi:hypothetical protein
MFKKAILGAAIVLVLAVAGITVAAATSSPAKASKHRVQTIQLVARQTGSTLLVLAEHGPVGNQFLSTDDLYRQGRKIGDDATVCQFMADIGQAGGRFQCLATLALPEGQLTAQGLATLTEAGGQPVTWPSPAAPAPTAPPTARPGSSRSARPKPATPSPSSPDRPAVGHHDAQHKAGA